MLTRGSTPLTMSCWLSMPRSRSSREARSASSRGAFSGRATNIRVVWPPSDRVATALAYMAFLSPRPESWPRQDAPWVLSSMKESQAEGSWSIRRVWPVGAVSKMIWSYWPLMASSVMKWANSLKDAISTVQEPESCSSMLAMMDSGSLPR